MKASDATKQAMTRQRMLRQRQALLPDGGPLSQLNVQGSSTDTPRGHHVRIVFNQSTRGPVQKAIPWATKAAGARPDPAARDAPTKSQMNTYWGDLYFADPNDGAGAERDHGEGTGESTNRGPSPRDSPVAASEAHPRGLARYFGEGANPSQAPPVYIREGGSPQERPIERALALQLHQFPTTGADPSQR